MKAEWGGAVGGVSLGVWGCFLSAHRSQVCRGGTDLRRSWEGKLCLRMPSVWGDPEVLGNIYNRTLQCRQKRKLSIFNIPVLRRQTLRVASFDLPGWYHRSLRAESNKDCNHWLPRGRAHWSTQVKHSAVIEGWRVGSGMFPPLVLRKHSIILCSRKSGLWQQADRSSATDVVSTKAQSINQFSFSL